MWSRAVSTTVNTACFLLVWGPVCS